MKNMLFTVCFFCFLGVEISAQATFQKKFSSSALGGDVLQGWDGNYIVAAQQDPFYSDTIVVYKVDTQGNIVWINKLYNASNLDCRSIVTTSDSGFVIAAGKIFRFDKYGNLLWQNGIPSGPVYYATEDDNGGIMACGTNTVGNGVIVRFDVTGEFIWKKVDGDYISGIQRMANGNYLVVGGQNDNFHLMHWDINGNKVFDTLISNVKIQSMTQLSNDTYLFSGLFTEYNGHLMLKVLRTDSIGTVFLNKSCLIVYNDYSSQLFASRAIEMDDGSYAVIANIGTSGNPRGILFKMSTVGELGFGRYYRYDGKLSGLAKTSDGGFILTGEALSGSAHECVFIKTDGIGKTY